MSTDHLSVNTPSPGRTDRAASTRPASGETSLRRPRDGRRSSRSRSTATGAIPIGGHGGEVRTTSIPLRGTGRPAMQVPGTEAAPAPDARSTVSVPKARVTGTPPSGLTGPIRHLLGPVTGSLRLGIARGDGATDQRLRVDWPQCKAHGLCAEIAPEIIRLDEWGYPVFDPGAVDVDDIATARKAVQVCPNLALRLVDIPPKS
jgi:ferredoxin